MGVISSKLNQRISPSRETSTRANGVIPNGDVSAIPQTLHNTTLSSKFMIVWLDADVGDSDIVYQNSLSRLQRVFMSLHTFTNIKECTKFLSSVRNEMILMVISNEFFEEIWPRVKSMSQIHSIFILSSAGEKVPLSDQEYLKVKGVFNRVEPICSSLSNVAPDISNTILWS